MVFYQTITVTLGLMFTGQDQTTIFHLTTNSSEDLGQFWRKNLATQVNYSCRTENQNILLLYVCHKMLLTSVLNRWAHLPDAVLFDRTCGQIGQKCLFVFICVIATKYALKGCIENNLMFLHQQYDFKQGTDVVNQRTSIHWSLKFNCEFKITLLLTRARGNYVISWLWILSLHSRCF